MQSTSLPISTERISMTALMHAIENASSPGGYEATCECTLTASLTAGSRSCTKCSKHLFGMSVDCAGLMCLSFFFKCWSLSLDICLYASLRDFAMSLTNPVRPAAGTAPQPDVDDSSLEDGLPHSLMTTACPQAEPDDDSSLDDVPKLEEVELLQMEADAENKLAAKNHG